MPSTIYYECGIFQNYIIVSLVSLVTGVGVGVACTLMIQSDSPRKDYNEALAALGDRQFEDETAAAKYADRELKKWAAEHSTTVTKV